MPRMEAGRLFHRRGQIEKWNGYEEKKWNEVHVERFELLNKGHGILWSFSNLNS